MQETRPEQPGETIVIGDTCYSFTRYQGVVTYFANQQPFDFHEVGDRHAELLRIANLAAIEGVKQRFLAAAFDVHIDTVRRVVVKLRKEGAASFFIRRKPRGRTAITGELQAAAERLLAEGKSGCAVARQLKISESTLSHNIRQGYIKKPGTAKSDKVTQGPVVAESELAILVDRSTRDQRDRVAPLGRAAKDLGGRIAASVGIMKEATPQFVESLSAVANGGVLAALPALLQEGLLHKVSRFLSLPKGYYGLNSTLLLLAFLFMARVRNPEALRHQAPGEWGALLGLDRCHEAKTLRGKVKWLAQEEEAVRAWQDSLAKTWVAQEPEVCATLSLDGHVKVYTGRRGRLPKHFVSRQKLCLPASTGYWLNALGGRPLLCLNRDLDPTMTQVIEQDVLPALARLGLPGADAPDLTDGKAVTPALTLVFDREGWSPPLFQRLARQGIAVITWHKHFKGDPWPEEDFATVQVPYHHPGGVRMVPIVLAEKLVMLTEGVEVRQIRRLMKNGRQVPLVTTDRQTGMAQLVGALFSRWCQENYFKYAKTNFNLDALAVHGLVEQDPEAILVNPSWRRNENVIKQLSKKIGSLRNRQATLSKHSKSTSSTQTAKALKAQIESLDAVREEHKRQRSDLPQKIKVAELEEDDKLDALPCGEKLLLDIIRMIVYRAECRMMPAVAEVQGKKKRPRSHLAELFQSAADIIPEPKNGILRVRIIGTASRAADATFTGLLEELNQTRTIYPGTNLRMVYELPGNG